MTINDIYTQLGKWKNIIVFNLYNAFFQNLIDPEAHQWLGIMTPFSGLRALACSGQGLLGQSEELYKLLLMVQILHQEYKESRAIKIQEEHLEATKNYITILEILYLANIRAEPNKTFIFPKTMDTAGWVWQEGRFLEVIPHTRSSLINTKEEDITKVKHMRSFIGLYKTLCMATPAMSRFITLLEDSVQGLQSTDSYVWNHSASQQFREAKSHIQNTHTLYLPHSRDQFVIKPDGVSNIPGIDHTLFTNHKNTQVPVRYYSANHSEQCRK